jgi:hypothetical protein
VFVRRVLPALLAVPFVAVLLVDLAAAIIAARVGEIDLLEGDGIRFEPAWGVVDLRAADGPPAAIPSGIPTRFGRGWGERVGAGRWTAGERAVLATRVGDVGGGEVVLRARPAPQLAASGEVPVVVRIGGVDLGERTLGGAFRVMRWRLPAGVARPGEVTIEIVVRAPNAAGAARSLLVSGVAVVGVRGVSWRQLVRPAAALQDGGAMVLRQPGTAVVAIPHSSRHHDLRVEHRFVRDDPSRWPVGHGAVVVVGTSDPPTPEPIDAGTWMQRRFSRRVGDSAGGATVEIRLDELSPGAELVVDVLRLEPDIG